jgi:hypothetical protein
MKKIKVFLISSVQQKWGIHGQRNKQPDLILYRIFGLDIAGLMLIRHI